MMLRPQLNSARIQQIRNLLKKSHKPFVKIAKSAIPGADNGVFYCHGYGHEESIVCLYPGIYTPGMPLSCKMNDMDYADDYYIADKTLPPSGIPFEDNAYILNVEQGGYIDGMALTSTTISNKNHKRRLDENPSACGHLVNHGSQSMSNSNVHLISFVWEDIGYDGNIKKDDNNRIDASDNYNMTNIHDYYQLPNSIRHDGSPWYYDPCAEKIVCFPKEDDGDSANPKHRQQKLSLPLLRGVAFALSKPVKHGEELLLDYKLTTPYPKWAREWYDA